MNEIIFIIPSPALAIVHGSPLVIKFPPLCIHNNLLLFLLPPQELVHTSWLSPLLDGTVAMILCHISMVRFCVLVVDAGRCAICHPSLKFGGAPLSIGGSRCAATFP